MGGSTGFGGGGLRPVDGHSERHRRSALSRRRKGEEAGWAVRGVPRVLSGWATRKG
jgi:hypothetical protein